MLKGRPPVDAKLALETVREANTSLQMWFSRAAYHTQRIHAPTQMLSNGWAFCVAWSPKVSQAAQHITYVADRAPARQMWFSGHQWGSSGSAARLRVFDRGELTIQQRPHLNALPCRPVPLLASRGMRLFRAFSGHCFLAISSVPFPTPGSEEASSFLALERRAGRTSAPCLRGSAWLARSQTMGRPRTGASRRATATCERRGIPAANSGGKNSHG